MAITLLAVDGFKSLRKVRWKPERLNVLIGPNGSGKSNLLDLLTLLSTAASGELSAAVQRSGGIDSLLWDGRENEIRILLKTLFDSPREQYAYSFTIETLQPRSGFRVAREELSAAEKILLYRDKRETFFFDERHGMTLLDAPIAEEKTLLAAVAGPLAGVSLSIFQAKLAAWTIYRDFDTSADSPVRQPALTRRETHIDSSGDNLVPVLHTLYTEDRQFRKELHSAMHAVFGNEFEELTFPPASDQKVQMRVSWRSLKRAQSSAVLSDGTLRFLFLVTVLANPDPPSLIAIEEPEVGLHPSMLPVIAEYAAEASKRCQVIFTTHSPDFLDAFRHASVQPTTTVTKWENGETHLNVLRGEDLEYWLREYTLGQLFRSNELEQIG